MCNTFLPFSPPLLGEDEINEVIDTLRSAWITTGPKVRRFEQEFAAFIGSMAALAVSSATDVRCDAGTIGKKIDVEAPTTAAVLIGIPRDVMHTARMSAGDMKRELALALFRQDRLSFGKARELAGMTVWAFQQLLGSFSCRGRRHGGWKCRTGWQPVLRAYFQGSVNRHTKATTRCVRRRIRTRRSPFWPISRLWMLKQRLRTPHDAACPAW